MQEIVIDLQNALSIFVDNKARWVEPYLLFHALRTEGISFRFRVPLDFVSFDSAVLIYTTAFDRISHSFSGNKAYWTLDFMVIASGDDPETESFDIVNVIAGGDPLPITSHGQRYTSITISDGDGAVAGNHITGRLKRIHNSDDDTLPGDAELSSLVLKYNNS